MKKTVTTTKHIAKVVKQKNESGKTQINDYQLEEIIGNGSLCKVKVATHLPTGLKYAVKIYNKVVLKKRKEHMNTPTGLKFRTAYDNVEKEIKIMETLHHPNIIELVEVLDNPKCEKLYLIMELADCGQVLAWNPDTLKFKPQASDILFYSESQVMHIFEMIAQGLRYLHSVGVVHRDIKPQNILMNSSGEIKITDFSAAEQIGDSDILTKTAGTYQFYSPEACDPHNTKGLPGKAGDVWALGVTVYALLFNQLPFWGDSIVAIFEAISTKPHIFLKSRDISEKIKLLVNQLLEKDPNKRYSLQEGFIQIIYLIHF